MPPVPASPADEYRARLAARREAHERLTRENARLSHMRLATFFVAVAVGLLAWFSVVTSWWLLLPTLVFVLLIYRHDRVNRALEASARGIRFYERGLARIEDRWMGTGETGERFRDDEHLYANDLDIFGRGSLFELLSIARTQAGEETLASWLTTAAPADEIDARHDALREITTALDLREALAQAGADVRAGVDTEALVTWAEGPPLLAPQWLRGVTVLLTGMVIASAVFGVSTGDFSLILVVLAAQGLFQMTQRRQVDIALHGVDGPARDLAILLHLVERLEREHFSSPRLAELRDRLVTDGVKASTAIRSLQKLVEMHDWEQNMLFAPIALALQWGTHLAWAIEGWRRTHGRRIENWLRAIGELEALSSLSAYRYEHPADPFPALVTTADASAGGVVAQFDGVRLGHPLLPAAQMVPNDVHLSGDMRLLVVSGSNMSGKSTLLRTVGINAVLALAGAPVRAESLRLSPLVIGATLRIQDSLQEGRSRFFAEITRIRHLADLAKASRPLLFLLDELFHGTNSHDRLVGASGVLRSLIERGAIGLITTHDLALTAVADDLAPRAVNVHFEDRFEHGEMLFDYRMKPGPVTHSNAVALMRAVGLDVGAD
jgi:hypothetical protein